MKNSLTNKPWITIPKFDSRHDSFLFPWKDLYKTLPTRKEQYYTMAGNVTDGYKLDERCDMVHVVKSGFFLPPQIYGAEIDPNIYNKGKELLPNHNWYNECISKVIRKKIDQGDFHPAIINIDHHLMIKNASRVFFNILNLLNYTDKKRILVSFNFMLLNPYNGKRDSIESVCEHLISSPDFWEFQENFNQYKYSYRYEGTGEQGKKEFMSLIFYKK